MRGAKASFFMRYRKQNSDGDYSFGRSLDDFHINSPDAVAQAIDTRLKLWVGEWFADTSAGTGWVQAILGKHSKQVYELTLSQRVLETPGVISIEDFSTNMEQSKRLLQVSMKVETIYGQTFLTEQYEW